MTSAASRLWIGRVGIFLPPTIEVSGLLSYTRDGTPYIIMIRANTKILITYKL